ncbi:MAG: hypothetical protein R6V58_11670 [Planctomycetota bacterium]
MAKKMLLCGVLTVLIAVPAVAAEEPNAAQRPKIEVVFCLDTTGSMSGLIAAAQNIPKHRHRLVLF